jgi:hypothetical protein
MRTSWKEGGRGTGQAGGAPLLSLERWMDPQAEPRGFFKGRETGRCRECSRKAADLVHRVRWACVLDVKGPALGAFQYAPQTVGLGVCFPRLSQKAPSGHRELGRTATWSCTHLLGPLLTPDSAQPRSCWRLLVGTWFRC